MQYGHRSPSGGRGCHAGRLFPCVPLALGGRQGGEEEGTEDGRIGEEKKGVRKGRDEIKGGCEGRERSEKRARE